MKITMTIFFSIHKYARNIGSSTTFEKYIYIYIYKYVCVCLICLAVWLFACLFVTNQLVLVLHGLLFFFSSLVSRLVLRLVYL